MWGLASLRHTIWGGVPLGLRDEQKKATRDKVVRASQALFEEAGYEATTIRMIAERAGVSVGSVFTTFESKVDIFNFILFEKFEALYGELERIRPFLKGSVRDRISSLLAIIYDFEYRQLNLKLSHLSAAHGWPERIELESRKRNQRLRLMFRQVLEKGVQDGDVRDDAELDLFIDMVFAVQSRNYHRAYYDRLTLEELTALTDQQLDVMFSGIQSVQVPASVVVA